MFLHYREKLEILPQRRSSETMFFSKVKRENTLLPISLGGMRGPETSLREEALPDFLPRWAVPQGNPHVLFTRRSSRQGRLEPGGYEIRRIGIFR